MPEEDSDSLIVTSSNKNSFSSEWSLFVHSFLDVDLKENPEVIKKIKNKGFSAIQIQDHKKKLSVERKRINQRIEDIKLEIEDKNNLIENLHLVGSDTENVIQEISDLTAEGESLSNLVFELEKELKKIREIETIL